MVDEHGSPLEGWFRPRPETAPADPAIDEIHRDEHCPGIFIGGIGAARNFAGLNAHGIKSVLDVAAGDPREQAGLELPAVAEHGTAARALAANTAVRRVEELHLSDSSADADEESDKLEAAALLLEQMARTDGPVLVHCTAGQSRSCAVATLCLMKMKEWSLREAYAHLKRLHPVAYPNYGLWCVMREKEKQWRGASSISQDALYEHLDIEFCVEEGDDEEDGSDWGAPPP
eukprot:Tamp_25137.p1 GENE.Tamp_25137~~Tamp_25137.p1  ORF type:complete len:238 (-),score=46.03 Tamp_25137:242-934(-)